MAFDDGCGVVDTVEMETKVMVVCGDEDSDGWVARSGGGDDNDDINDGSRWWWLRGGGGDWPKSSPGMGVAPKMYEDICMCVDQEGVAGDRRVPEDGEKWCLSTGDKSGGKRAEEEGVQLDESKYAKKG
nr:hypothetical protein [Tanacetum cinerariifolium]